MSTSKSLVTAGVSVMGVGLVVNLVLDVLGSTSVSRAGTALFILAIAIGLALVAMGAVAGIFGRVPRRRRRRRPR